MTSSDSWQIGTVPADGTAATVSVIPSSLGWTIPSHFYFEAAGTGSRSFEGATDALYMVASTSSSTKGVLMLSLDDGPGETPVLTELDSVGASTPSSEPRFICPAPEESMVIAYEKHPVHGSGFARVGTGTNQRFEWLASAYLSTQDDFMACNYSIETGRGDGSVWYSNDEYRLWRLDIETGVMEAVNTTMVLPKSITVVDGVLVSRMRTSLTQNDQRTVVRDTEGVFHVLQDTEEFQGATLSFYGAAVIPDGSGDLVV